MIDILHNYSPYIQQYSIDEAFLDYTFNGNYNYLEIARNIEERIKKELGFTVNIGIGDNKLLAKMGSEFLKPDRVHMLFKEEIKMKMWPLAVEKLFMVGSKTKFKLNGRGIYTIGELVKLDKEYIYNWLKKPGLLIWEYANGIENSPVRTTEPLIKSLSNSTTTPREIGNRVEANLVLLGISEMLGMRIRALNIYGSVIAVPIKDNNFISYRKQKSLYIPTNSTVRYMSNLSTYLIQYGVKSH